MRKIVFGLVFLLSCLLLAACGEDNIEKLNKTQNNVLSETTDKKQPEENREDLSKNEEDKTAGETSSIKSLGLVEAKVSRVVDGDTIVLSDGSKVRLIGVNTPESTNKIETYGKEASNYTKSKLEGKKVYLQKDVSETDRYNRLLRLVWLEVPKDLMDEKEIRTKMFNADLVLNGYAEPYTFPPDVTYSEYFVKFAREARQKEVGLWAYGDEGTTRGDLDSSSNKKSSSNAKSNSSHSSKSNNSSGNSFSKSSGQENFQNCTELRKVYPDGVPSTHPAYQPKMDRDKDNWACER